MSARTTLTDLIDTLRGLTDAGTLDWSQGTAQFWDGDHMQAVLDRHRVDVEREPLRPVPALTGGGTIEYRNYYSQFKNWEQTDGGTAVLIVEDSIGNDIGTASYSVDYPRGVVVFAADTAGTPYYLTGRTYDLDAAAAEIWRSKASHYATTAIDFSTDNMRINRSQIVDHCFKMAALYEGRSGESVSVGYFTRSDIDPEALR